MAAEIPVDELVRFKLDKSGIDRIVKGVASITDAQKRGAQDAATAQKSLTSNIEQATKAYEDFNGSSRQSQASLQQVANTTAKINSNVEDTVESLTSSAQAASILQRELDKASKIQSKMLDTGKKYVGGVLTTGAQQGATAMSSALESGLAGLGIVGLILAALGTIVDHFMILNGYSKLLAANVGAVGGSLGGSTATIDHLRSGFLMTTEQAGDFVVQLARAGGKAAEISGYADDIYARQLLFGVGAQKQMQYMVEMGANLNMSASASDSLLTNTMKIGASLKGWSAEEFLDQAMDLVRKTRDLNANAQTTLAFFTMMADTDILKKSGLADFAKLSKQGRIELTQAVAGTTKLDAGKQAFLARMGGLPGTPIEQIVAMRKGAFLKDPAMGLNALFKGAQEFSKGRKGADREFITQEYLKQFAPDMSEQSQMKLAEIFTKRMETGQSLDPKAITAELKRVEAKNASPQAKVVKAAEDIAKDLKGWQGVVNGFIIRIIERIDKLVNTDLFKVLDNYFEKITGVDDPYGSGNQLFGTGATLVDAAGKQTNVDPNQVAGLFGYKGNAFASAGRAAGLVANPAQVGRIQATGAAQFEIADNAAINQIIENELQQSAAFQQKFIESYKKSKSLSLESKDEYGVPYADSQHLQGTVRRLSAEAPNKKGDVIISITTETLTGRMFETKMRSTGAAANRQYVVIEDGFSK